jgi:adenylosuccinate synthase
MTDITKITDQKDLPETMKNYIDFINNYLGVDVSYISNGPGREQIIKA